MTPTLALLIAAQNQVSGGTLTIEQAAYDVLSYDIAIKVDPTTKSIQGTTEIKAKAVIPTATLLLDLDTPYTVSTITDGTNSLRFDRLSGQIRVFLPQSKQPNESITLQISYHGQPHVARNAPWDGGIMWSKTPSGADWVSVALQGAGADLLFPCKDHPSDRPDQATMRLTVPDPLTAVGPGTLKETTKNTDKTTTFVWHMPLPINNYSLVFNAAPYDLVKDQAKSITGENVPIHFYVLPENKDKAPALIAEQKKYLAFMEKYCGPYPFRSVKLGIVETPHLGMEHSTAVAYGNKFRLAADGLDWLLLHEFGHEWWANLVTDSDWRDMWIHEGFQSFLDSLYIEEIRGKKAYFDHVKNRRRNVRNAAPVAPREQTSSEAYGNDIYDKGALTLHALRYLIGDEAFFKSIRLMAYPDPNREKTNDGSALRFATTDDFVTIASKQAGQDLSWFFEVYVRQAAAPVLKSTIENGTLTLRWETPNNLPFPMPINVQVGDLTLRVPMTNNQGTLQVGNATPIIDPDGWVYHK